MRRNIAFLLLMLLSQLTFAQVESVIDFKGQNAETINIEKTVKFVRAIPVEVPSTCTRQVPYESYECNDVTRYRQQCQWVPEHQNCWNEPDRVCRPVTRTRQECTNGPSRRVCRDIPTRQVCTDRPTRRVCTERPTRRVCRDVNGRQQCTTVGGGQHCTTVGGGRDCRTVGGGQTCHNEPGPRVCRNVSYTDQECTTVSRRRCQTIPGQNQCQDIPYTEEVCGNVTRHREETYACTRTEQQERTFEKVLKGPMQVKFLTNGLVEEFPLSVVFAPKSAEHKEFSLTASLKAEPEVLVIVRDSQVEVLEETETEISLEGELTIEVLESQMVTPVFPIEISKASYDKETDLLTLEFEGGISAVGAVELSLKHRGWFGRRSLLAAFKGEYPSSLVEVKENQILINMKEAMAERSPTSKMEIQLKLKADPSVQGEILNAKKPKSEHEYGSLRVSLE